MKPYPSRQLDLSKRVFNLYTLFKTRRVVENVFGILASRFRVFNRTIDIEPERAHCNGVLCTPLLSEN